MMMTRNNNYSRPLFQNVELHFKENYFLKYFKNYSHVLT